MKSTTTMHCPHLRRLLCTVLAVLSFAFTLVPTALVGAEYKVHITYNGQTVDSLNGVDAKYITGNSDTDKTYSCAGYVKSYYSKIYGVGVYNLNTGCKPRSSTSGYSFQEIKSNFQVGDIVYMTNPRGKGHWAIAKSISGNSVTLIEQNWKKDNYASVDRVVNYGSTKGMRVFRLNGGNSNSSSSSKSNSDSSSRSYSASDVAALLFDARYYTNAYTDLFQAFGYNTAKLKNHWNQYGKTEGRTASPIFDPKWYLENNPDVANAYGSTNYKGAYEHFCQYGFAEGRQGSPIFSVKYYLSRYSDLSAAFGNDYLAAAKHFLTYGIDELRQASSTFSIETYTACNPDLAVFSDPMDRIAHYVQYVQYGPEERKCI